MDNTKNTSLDVHENIPIEQDSRPDSVPKVDDRSEEALVHRHKRKDSISRS